MDTTAKVIVNGDPIAFVRADLHLHCAASLVARVITILHSSRRTLKAGRIVPSTIGTSTIILPGPDPSEAIPLYNQPAADGALF